MKRLQNRIAESGALLPVSAFYALAVWLLTGLLTGGAWPQLACYVAAVYLLVELSTGNALLRVRSRMVSCTFIFLSCMTPGLFSSLSGVITLLCWVIAILILFSAYQDNQAVGRTFYAFAFLGGASIAFIQSLWLIPVLWILMATQLQMLGVRTFFASIIGLLAPYWFFALWFIYIRDFTPLLDHLAGLWTIDSTPDILSLPVGHVCAFLLTTAMSLSGIIHFWLRSFEDKIRIRLLHGFFFVMTLLLLVLAVLQPQHFGTLMLLAYLFASPLVAHYLTFTSTRLTNILFFVVLSLAVLIMALNLWMPSLHF